MLIPALLTFFQPRRHKQALVIAVATILMSNAAQASLMLDPGATAPELTGQASASPTLNSGFVPLVFKPTTEITAQSATWALKSSPVTRPDAVHWHVQNAMPWPVTVNITLSDAQGGRFETAIALPPGPAQTIVIPTLATLPIQWGMRSPPPQPLIVEQERLLVATTTTGSLSSAPARISISMPTPDSDQTVLLGKVFLRPGRNDIKRLYSNLIDCFGQFARGDWPEKQAGECEPNRMQDRQAPDEPESNQNQLSTDRFGGLIMPAWPTDKLATGAFRVYRHTGDGGPQTGRWILLTPEGNPLFSLGVNAVQLNNSETFVEGREFMFTDLPGPTSPLSAFYGGRNSTDVLPADAGAQAGRKFGSGKTYDFYRANLFRKDGPAYAERWQKRTAQRLRQWSFNTAAAWSDDSFTNNADLAYTAIIHVEGPFQRLSDGHNWWQGIPDVFDPAFKTSVAQTFARTVPAHRHNEHLIGYFVDNELAWGDGSAANPAHRYGPVLSALAMHAQDKPAFAKRAFVRFLKSRYGDIDQLATAWQMSISSWRQIEAPVLTDQSALPARLRNSDALRSDLSALLSLHAGEYFRLVADNLRAFDPDHLYLGSRFASRTPEAVAACVEHCDVVSFNLYVPDIASGFEAESFARHNKPAMLTEFHFGSADRGPFWAGVMRVAREQDRGPAYQKMIDSVLANEQFVGAHWFQYLDQMATGRWLDGENGHLGLVGITDQPWREFTATVSRTNAAALRRIKAQLTQGK